MGTLKGIEIDGQVLAITEEGNLQVGAAELDIAAVNTGVANVTSALVSDDANLDTFQKLVDYSKGKVEQEVGKGLSSEDFTAGLRVSVEELKIKAITTEGSNLVVVDTDDVTTTINLEDLVTDLTVEGATLDATTNVLTLVTSDGDDITVDLSVFVNTEELDVLLATKADATDVLTPVPEDALFTDTVTTAVELMALIDSTADVNILTDAEKELVANLLTDTAAKVQGFDTGSPDSMGTMEFCLSAASGVFWRIDQYNTHSSFVGQTHFGDGTALADRMFIQYPSEGMSSFSFWNRGKLYTKTVTQTLVLDNVAHVHLVAYDSTGTLAQSPSTEVAITNDTLCTVININPTHNKKVIFANERHGRYMSSATHLLEHETTGARCQRSGFTLHGVVNNSTEFTLIEGGTVYDEDIHNIIEATYSAVFAWREGADGDWMISATADSKLGYKNEYDEVCYNIYDNDSNEWELKPIGSDYVVMHMFATNDGENGIFKIVGQNLYPDRTAARQNLFGDASTIEIGELPSPEFVHLYSMIINSESNGTIETGPDKEIYVDFRMSYPISRYGN